MGSRRVGLIGIGKWGKTILVELLKLEEVEVVCTGTQKPETIAWLTRTYPQVTFHQNVDDVLSDSNLTHVVIATPIKTHQAIVEQCLQRGKHVFIEKPMVTDSVEARRLFETAQQAQKVLLVDHLYSKYPAYEKLKELFSHTPIREYHSNWFKFGSFKEDIFWNLLYHDVYLLLGLINEPLSDIKVVSRVPFYTPADSITVAFTVGHKTTVSLSINRLSPQKTKQVQVLSEGVGYCWHNEQLFELNPQQQATEIPLDTRTSPLAAQLSRFLSLQPDDAWLVQHQASACQATEVIEQILQSTRK